MKLNICARCECTIGATITGKKVLWFYYSSTVVFLEEIGTVKLWASIQRIFPIQNLSIT